MTIETEDLCMDTRVASIEGKIDAFLAQSEGTAKLIEAISLRAAVAAESAAKSADRAGGLKATLWITSLTTILSVVGIVLAAYFGTQQSNIGIVQSTIAAFESGRGQATQTAAPTAAAPSATPPHAPPSVGSAGTKGG